MTENMSDNTTHDDRRVQPEAGYETSDASLLGVAGFAAVLTVATLIVLAMLWWLLGYLIPRQPAGREPASELAAQEHGRLPPSPQLEGLAMPPAGQPAPGAAEEYGWVDRKAGIVRVPLDEAMRIVIGKFSPPPRKK
jgi:hypothetical protein